MGQLFQRLVAVKGARLQYFTSGWNIAKLMHKKVDGLYTECGFTSFVVL